MAFDPYADLHDEYKKSIYYDLSDIDRLDYDSLNPNSATSLSIITEDDLFRLPPGERILEDALIKALPVSLREKYLKLKGPEKKTEKADMRKVQFLSIQRKAQEDGLKERDAAEWAYRLFKRRKTKGGFSLSSFDNFYTNYRVYKSRTKNTM